VSRYRLYPSPEQEAILREHCSHARYVWNLAWNSHQFGTLETYGKASRRADRDGNEYIYQKRRPVRPLPTYVEQARMLTEARAEYAWLAAGAQNVQQQALRDFSQAMRNFYAGTHGYPGRRKRHLNEGFRITDFTFSLHVRRLNRRWARSGCQRSAGCGSGGHASYQSASPTASLLTIPGGGTSHSLWFLSRSRPRVPARRSGSTGVW
jgi:putative transposase